MFTFRIFITLIITTILQSVVIPHFSIGGIVPNISVVVLISFSFLLNRRHVKYIGLILGLIQDILFSPIIGVNSLIYFLIGVITEKIDDRVQKDNYIMFLLAITIASFIYNLFFYIIMFFLGSHISLAEFIKNKFWIEVIYNLIISIPIYLIMKNIFYTPEQLFTRK